MLPPPIAGPEPVVAGAEGGAAAGASATADESLPTGLGTNLGPMRKLPMIRPRISPHVVKMMLSRDMRGGDYTRSRGQWLTVSSPHLLRHTVADALVGER